VRRPTGWMRSSAHVPAACARRRHEAAGAAPHRVNASVIERTVCCCTVSYRRGMVVEVLVVYRAGGLKEERASRVRGMGVL
jgi:hypothetical protein